MSMSYFVYDIESVVDKKLLNSVMYAGEGLSDEEAHEKHVAATLEKTGSNFISASFHCPVALVGLALDKDYTPIKIGVLGEGARTSEAIVRHFWKMYNATPFVPVDYNGRGYDMRLLELWAYRLGIGIHYRHFDKFGVRYRYSDDKHLDLQEALTNNLSVRYQGGLNLFAKMLGKPGKLDTKGDMVEELYQAGDHFRIEDYCHGDVFDTYFVFLRWMVVKGKISLQRESELVTMVTEMARSYAKETGYLKTYLEALEKSSS